MSHQNNLIAISPEGLCNAAITLPSSMVMGCSFLRHWHRHLYRRCMIHHRGGIRV